MRHERLSAITSHAPVRLAIALLLLCIAPACGSNDNPGGPSSSGGGGGGLTPGTMRATVDGVVWTGTINVAAIATGNFLVMTGETGIGTPNQILLSISTPAQVGTSTAASGLTVGTYVTLPTSVSWLSVLPGGSGTVTVSTFSSTSATGTFSFVMVPSTGAGPNKVVTNGAFNARIPTP